MAGKDWKFAICPGVEPSERYMLYILAFLYPRSIESMTLVSSELLNLWIQTGVHPEVRKPPFVAYCSTEIYLVVANLVPSWPFYGVLENDFLVIRP